MIDIFNMPLYYISFKQKPGLEIALKEQGFTNIHHFKAIDGRKLNVEELKNKNAITIRTYNDLHTQRKEHSGIPSLGSIGCTLSHYELWKKCIKNNYKHIIIVEDDLIFPKKFTDSDISFISNTLSKSKSAFFATTIKKENTLIEMTLLHFCIISQDACKELVKYTFPIDVQTDFYISHLATKKLINIDAKPIAQQSKRPTSIQNTCIKCSLPDDESFYIIVTALIVSLLLVSIILIVQIVNKTRF